MGARDGAGTGTSAGRRARQDRSSKAEPFSPASAVCGWSLEVPP